MKKTRLIILCAGFVLGLVCHASTILVDVQPLGSSAKGPSSASAGYRYTFTLNDLSLHSSPDIAEELDIRFDPGLFGSLSNATGPSGLELMLFQPNNPPGESGDLSVSAVPGNGGPYTGVTLHTAVTVDVSYLGANLPPRILPFQVNRFSYDQTGAQIGFDVQQAGNTTPVNVVPEPTGLAMVAGILALWAFRRIRSTVPELR
jgi:hypothetical protein